MVIQQLQSTRWPPHPKLAKTIETGDESTRQTDLSPSIIVRPRPAYCQAKEADFGYYSSANIAKQPNLIIGEQWIRRLRRLKICVLVCLRLA